VKKISRRISERENSLENVNKKQTFMINGIPLMVAGAINLKLFFFCSRGFFLWSIAFQVGRSVDCMSLSSEMVLKK
jgi:hypothetical protein